MNADASLLSYVLNAGWVVKAVLLILLAASIYSWGIIIQKWQVLRAANKHARLFEDRFWQTDDLAKLYQKLQQGAEHSGLAHIFQQGLKEFSRLRREGAENNAVLEGVLRTMRAASQRELDRLEHNLPALATIGSTAPYVGLFGTVWGIMSSFQGLSQVQQATIAMVAPGISEALVATAMGLFAAIPAVVAYNRAGQNLQQLSGRFDAFQEEFAALLHRDLHRSYYEAQ